MSYDGGLSISINNKKLKELLDEFEGKGVNLDPFYGEEYDFEYEYMDCSYVSGCPKDLDDLKDYLIELFEVYNDGEPDFKEFKKSFKGNYSEIKDSFTYVLWEYYPDNISKEDIYDGEYLVKFEYGPIKKEK